MRKTKTAEDFIDYVDAEHSWRRKELTIIKSNISNAKGFALETALRAGITLLYAHWEGFIKNCAEAYLYYVSSLKLNYSLLNDSFLAISLKNEIEKAIISKKPHSHMQIVRTIMQRKTENSKIPYKDVIKTNSNLNSEVFQEIMAIIGLETNEYECSYNMLDGVLLKMRNEIAHGEKVEYLSLDKARFNEIYEEIITMINTFDNQIENAVLLKRYLKGETSVTL